ncbi:hypothetical protein [Streptomyces shenzhenensis]|uniref:Uncharacterized protein n=1 Tax=Streptomyces shenzhenensis TaxID=943815 RepID=A0A3M0ITV9_9ACTN|nr:hypothetical protein [Streptomyces shenzhenensis]RMB85606.1 hypothetical protein CTZ28_12500 [Streptomyces shenzhenensis]
MKHFTAALCVLYTVASIALLRCAVASQQHGQAGYTALFTTCTVLFALGVVHHAYHRDELRAALLRLERAARPPDTRPAIDDAVAIALATACCETWWATTGAQHDPEHCTRKDTTA